METPKYSSGLASLFSTVAREITKPRYVTHYDFANSRWNVFKRIGLREDYVCYFDLLTQAQTYCDEQNGVNDAAAR